jgi:hypothetical protein
LQLRILGEDNASSAFNSVSGAARAAQQIIVDFTKQSVKAYMESERVQRQLQLVAKDLTGAFQSQATAMAQSMNISDELVQQLQTMLLRYGEAPGAVNATTQAVLDYAAATGTDARTATELLTRGVESGSGHFKGLGIAIQATGDRTKDLAAATAELAKKYGGAGQADADSLTGQVRGLEEAFGDVQEAFGGFIAEIASKTGVIGSLTTQLREVAALMGQLGAMDPRQALSYIGQQVASSPVASLLSGGTSTFFGMLAAGGDETQSAARGGLATVRAQQAKQAAMAAAALGGGGAGRGGRISGGAGGGGGSGGLAGDMYGPQTYAEWANSSIEGPAAPSPDQQAAMAKAAADALRRQVETHDKAMADIERLGKEMAAKLAQQTKEFAQVGASMGAALANNLTSALESLAGGGEQDIGKIIANILAGLLTTAGGLLGNLLLPGIGGALGSAVGGLAGAGVRAAANAGPTVNINTFDARSTREFFEADGGRGLYNAQRTGRGQGW